jgi:hypothetical protein
MKTIKFFKPRSFTLLTVSTIAALSLAACGKRVQFAEIVRGPGSLSESPDPTEPTDDVQPDPGPGETDGPGPINSKLEIFKQGTGGKVDILFVVDNSPSMQAEQKKLSQRLQAFMSGLKSTDWQIAFTTTDVSNGSYGIKGSLLDLAGHAGQKVLTPAFADADTVFLKTVQRPEVGTSNEQPLKASILAMQKHSSESAGFFRSDADLAIIVLSDEDEMSTGHSKSATKPADVIAAFKAIFGTTKKLSTYGIIIQPGDVACYDKQKGSGNFANAFYGSHVSELSSVTGGLTGSICAQDYSQTLVDIGNDVRLLSNSFTLQSIPLAGSVEVALSPVQNIAWTVSGNKVVFATSPQDGTVVQVKYNVAP